MKVKRSQLKQIILEEIKSTLSEWDPGTFLSTADPTSSDPADFPRSFAAETPETTDLAEFSPSEAFGMAWTKAIEFLKTAGMEEAAQVLEKQSSSEGIDEGMMDKLATAAKSAPVKVLKLQLRKLSGTKRADFVVQIIRNLLDNDEKALAGLANRLSGVKRGLTEPEGQEEQPEPAEV